MIFAHYDTETFTVKAVYDKKLHSNIPEPNIEITQDEYAEYLKKINSDYVIKVAGGLERIEFIPVDKEIIRQRKLAQITLLRDEKLQASDWTQLSDIPLSDSKKKEWVDYRDKLRKMMATVNPDNPQFPIEPKPE